MADVNDYHKGAGYYEFPDGVKVRGKDDATEYLSSLEEFDSAEDEYEEAEETEPEVEEEAVEEEVVEEEPVEEETEGDEPEAVLIEMTRQNRLFEVNAPTRRYTFRKDARIMVVDGRDVEKVLSIEGFRVVDPIKAKEYYS